MTTAHGDERAKVIDARVLAAIAPSMTPRERVQALAELRALLVGNRHRRTTTTTTRGVKRTPWKPSGKALKSALAAVRRAVAMVEDALAVAERSVLASSLCVKLVRDILEQLSPLCGWDEVQTIEERLEAMRNRVDARAAEATGAERREREFGRVPRRLAH